MKRKLLTILFTTFGAISTFAQFTAGNLAIYRYGDGTSMTNGGRVPVFVDEYTPSGTFVKTIAIPRGANGANFGFEGMGLKNDGTFETEGFPVLSKDGTTLSIIGYHPVQAGEFVIGTLNAAGTWIANTLVASDDAIGTPRSAVIAGNAVYFNGYQGGVRYKTLGTTASSIRVSAGQSAPRILSIAETSAIGSPATAGLRIFAADNTDNMPMSNLVTTSSTFVFMAYSGNKPANAHQIIAMKSPAGRTLIYMIDDNGGAPLIRKYRSNADGGTWIAYGTASVPLGTKSLAAKVDASGANLYYTTYGTVGGNDSKLYHLFDPFTGGNEQLNLSATAVQIATAPANTTFRGVTMAPVSNTLPVKLTAFNANEKNGSIRLNWSTASESNNAYFNIFRAMDNTDFIKIAQVNGNGTSTNASNYSFLDEYKGTGTLYYKLQQVDFDGNGEWYGPVSVNIPVKKTMFNAAKVGEQLELTIYSTKSQEAKIDLVDLNGKRNYKQSYVLNNGYNKLILPVAILPSGLHIVVLNTTEGKITKKVIW